jgi:membrane associated rhomboid family serine protease
VIPLRDLNPTRTTPFITVGLIAANILVFLFQVSLATRQQNLFVLAYATTPFEITHGVDIDPKIGFPVYLTIFTAMFMHGGWLHIIGNMLYLWIFGNNVEDRFGHIRFLLIYLAWGVAAAFAQILVEPNSRIPALGASGAIAGVLGAYLVIFPTARVDVLVFLGYFGSTVRLPAMLVVGGWILLQFFSGFASVTGAEVDGGVAYFAHIGGAIAGVAVGLIYRVLNPRSAEYGYDR